MKDKRGAAQRSAAAEGWDSPCYKNADFEVTASHFISQKLMDAVEQLGGVLSDEDPDTEGETRTTATTCAHRHSPHPSPLFVVHSS